MTATYENAKQVMDSAQESFDVVVASYRCGVATDAEYLAARAVYEKEVATFDAAYAVAAGWAK